MNPNEEIVSVGMAEVLRTKSGAERLSIAGELWEFTRCGLERILRAKHPQWSQRQIQAEIIWRTHRVRI